MKRMLLPFLLVAGLSGCDAPGLTEPDRLRPEPTNVAAQASALAFDPLADVLARIAPALPATAETADLKARLAALRAGRDALELAAVLGALDLLHQADSTLLADVDAIRLALGVVQ